MGLSVENTLAHPNLAFRRLEVAPRITRPRPRGWESWKTWSPGSGDGTRPQATRVTGGSAWNVGPWSGVAKAGSLGQLQETELLEG
jgi:hypothetical protein